MKRENRNTWILITISFSLILLYSGDCMAFRCGKGLVTTGDTKTKVLVECGKPTYKENAGSKKDKTRTKSKSVKIADGVTHQTNHRMSTKKVEKWFYNCGDSDFIYVLEFENGILQREDTTGRGKGKSDCTGK
jgi:hypothetical protein